MKTVLIAAITADGFIAKHATHLSDWTSKADKQHFVRLTKELGTVVMGSRTFDTIGRPLPGRTTVVMTRRPLDYAIDGVETFGGTPAELHSELSSRGLPGLAVLGGAEIYGQFLSAGLIDELVLTVEPRLFGQGISLSSAAVDAKLQLISSERVGDNSVILRYKVER